MTNVLPALPSLLLTTIVSKTALKRSDLQRRIIYATIVTIDNNWFITIYIPLEIRSEKKDSKFIYQPLTSESLMLSKPSTILLPSLLPKKIYVTHSKDILSCEEYDTMFPNIRICDVTKRMYLIHKLEYTHKVSSLKYDLNKTIRLTSSTRFLVTNGSNYRILPGN